MKNILIAGVLGLLMAGCGKKEPTEAELNSFRELKAQESVKALLKDPSSAEFRNMNGMCGVVRFIGTPDVTVIEGENPQVDQATFNEVWKKMC